MPYLVLKDGKVLNLPVRIVKAEGHHATYAHGASGGPLANYHYRIDFYVDEAPPYNYLDPVGDGTIDPESFKELRRTVVATIFLPLPSAKELQLWLAKGLTEFENRYGDIRLPKDDRSLEEQARMIQENEEKFRAIAANQLSSNSLVHEGKSPDPEQKQKTP